MEVKQTDLNNDGEITKEEANVVNILTKTETQSKLAYIIIIAAITSVISLYFPIVSVEKIAAIEPILTTFITGSFTTICAFMGVTAFLGSKLNKK